MRQICGLLLFGLWMTACGMQPTVPVSTAIVTDSKNNTTIPEHKDALTPAVPIKSADLATNIPLQTTAIPTSESSNSGDELSGEAAPQLPATVTDMEGQTVEITDVGRVVSLNGDITEIIFALGMGDYIVGVDSSATYPPEETKKRANIGYQRRLNAEGILALNPTLVIGRDGSGPPEALTQIRDAGVPIALVAVDSSLKSAAQKISFVAQALGVPQRGAALNARLEADLAKARELLTLAQDTQPRVLFLYMRGTEVQQVAGSNTGADTIIQAAGAVNAAAEVGIQEFKPLSPEVIIASQPDVLLLLDKGLESVGGVDGLLALPGLADTPAGKARRVVSFDDLYLLGLGPRTGLVLQDLIHAFHDEVK